MLHTCLDLVLDEGAAHVLASVVPSESTMVVGSEIVTSVW